MLQQPEVLIPEASIRDAVATLADRLNRHYGARSITILGIATGCIVFLSDLMRHLRMPVHIELIRARSYHGATTTAGPLHLDLWGLTADDIRGRSVLVVDDIFDTGHTLTAVADAVKAWEAADVRSAVLLEKEGRREVQTKPDFVALRVPNRFVVGYGLDYDGRFRNLPYIGVVDGVA